MQKAGAIFDTAKLDWLQGQWMRKIPPEVFAERIRWIIAERFPAAASNGEFPMKASLIRERITFFAEAPEMLHFFYEEHNVSLDLLTNAKQKVTKENLPKIFALLIATLESLSSWQEEELMTKLTTAASAQGFTKGQLLWPLRVALTGLPYSPGAFEVAAALGKEKTLGRLRKCQDLS